MIFPCIIELYPQTKLNVSNCPWQICSCLRAYLLFQYFQVFFKSRNRKCPSFSLLRNLITPLHIKFLPKLRRNYKNIAFRGGPAANCTLMVVSIKFTVVYCEYVNLIGYITVFYLPIVNSYASVHIAHHVWTWCNIIKQFFSKRYLTFFAFYAMRLR